MKLDFWKHNKLDEHYQMDSVEVAEQFRAWLEKQDDWEAKCKYYRGGHLVVEFISRELESAWAHDEPTQEDEVFEIGYQVIWGDNGLMERGVA